MLMLAGLMSIMAIGSIFVGGSEDLFQPEEDQEEELPFGDSGSDSGYFELDDFDPRASLDDQLSNNADYSGMFEPEVDQAPSVREDIAEWSMDQILVGGDDDFLGGGAGDDDIGGGAGDDTLFGGDGYDDIHGQLGDDLLFGGNDADTLHGQDGDDDIYGDFGDDELYGYFGDDALNGGLGADQLHGGQGKDALFGEDGDDALSGGYGDDMLQGGAGRDTLMGGRGNDLVDGTTGALSGEGADADFLNGGAGDDTILVGSDDVASGGSGADIFVLDANQTQAAQITDFVPGEDSIVINLAADQADPHLAITPVDGDPNTSILSNNGQIIATITGTTGLTMADIVVDRI